MSRLFEDTAEEEKPSQNLIIPPNPPVAQPTMVLGKSVRPKLANAESTILIITTLLILVGYGNNFNQPIITRIQLLLLWSWFIGGVWVLYKHFNLFGGEFPKDEVSKLTTTEKALLLIVSIINPSIVGIVALTLWHKNQPKARRANMIVMTVFLIEIALGIYIAAMQSKVGN